MKIFKEPVNWQNFRKNNIHQTLGFVPTMGSLHEGHLSLIHASQKENDATLVSIFVNPKQFNCKNDFQHYPRNLEKDCDLLKQANVDYCFIPSVKSLYPDWDTFSITIPLASLSMEGQLRPGHFSGMLTIVMKLLTLMNAETAYFGEKDYQQYELVHQLTQAFFISTKIVLCPTIRDHDGLAKSSRNQRLSEKERQLAGEFPKIFLKKNISDHKIINELEALGIHVEYVETHANRRFAAIRIGNVRLIDTISLTQPSR